MAESDPQGPSRYTNLVELAHTPGWRWFSILSMSSATKPCSCGEDEARLGSIRLEWLVQLLEKLKMDEDEARTGIRFGALVPRNTWQGVCCSMAPEFPVLHESLLSSFFRLAFSRWEGECKRKLELELVGCVHTEGEDPIRIGIGGGAHREAFSPGCLALRVSMFALRVDFCWCYSALGGRVSVSAEVEALRLALCRFPSRYRRQGLE
ncbi:hypothetical protein V8C35DRAFT_146942 [Trichoderma chlorosporum]